MFPRFVMTLVAAVAAGAACAPPDTSQRGFGSTLVTHVRDEDLSLRSFSPDATGIYLAHGLPDLVVAKDTNAPYDRSLVSFATGLDQPIARWVISVQLLPTADGLGRWMVMTHFASDADIPANLSNSDLPFVELTFLDELSGASLDIHNIDSRSLSLGATRSDPILVSVEGADGTGAPWKGPPENLMLMRRGFNQLLGRDHLGFVGLSPSADGGSTQSFSRAPFDGSQLVEIVPGVLGAHTVVNSDDNEMPPVTAVVPSTGVVPAISCSAPSVADPAPRCLLLYDRVTSTAARVAFAYLLDEGIEMELPGQLTSAFANVVHMAPGGRDAFWPSTANTDETRIVGWHVGDDHAATCAFRNDPRVRSFGISAWRPGTRQFVTVAQPNNQTGDKPGSWLLVGGTAGTECHVVTSGMNLISQLFYAPDGSQIAFLETDPGGVSKVYVSDGDAGPPRVVATGAYFFNIDFPDPRHLLLWHSNTDGYSVSWPDLSATPAIEHPIADRVRWDARGSWAWINPRWVLLADADSIPDGSYSLNVVDVETGARQLVSRGVVDFRVSWSTPPAGATELTVAYMVRSRAPSAQDGLWVAHLAIADFPP